MATSNITTDDGNDRREAERRAIAAILAVESDLLTASAIANISGVADAADQGDLRTSHLLVAEILGRVRERLYRTKEVQQ